MSQKRPPELNFISIQTPTDARSRSFRSQVRSHVSRRQHQRARDVRKKTRTRELQDQVTYVNNAPFTPASIAASGSYSSSQDDLPRDVASDNLSRTAHSPVRRSFAHGTASFSTFMIEDSDNVVGTALEAFGFDAMSVMTFYDKVIVAQQVMNFEMQNASWVAKGFAHPKFVATVFMDPALLAAVMLITTRFLHTISGRPLSPKIVYHCYEFRGFIIQAITKALSDHKRSVSDPLLVAVLITAAYELHYGNVASYHIHMKGLVQMIDMRGGMQELGREDPYLEGFILWHDSNASTIAGCAPYCSRVEGQSRMRKPKADPKMFRMNREGSERDPEHKPTRTEVYDD